MKNESKLIKPWISGKRIFKADSTFRYQDAAVLFRQGSGFASIHSTGESASVSLALSGAAHEVAAGHAFPDSMQHRPAFKRNGQADLHSMAGSLHGRQWRLFIS